LVPYGSGLGQCLWGFGLALSSPSSPACRMYLSLGVSFLWNEASACSLGEGLQHYS
jgi:hypothetical protein